MQSKHPVHWVIVIPDDGIASGNTVGAMLRHIGLINKHNWQMLVTRRRLPLVPQAHDLEQHCKLATPQKHHLGCFTLVQALQAIHTYCAHGLFFFIHSKALSTFNMP